MRFKKWLLAAAVTLLSLPFFAEAKSAQVKVKGMVCSFCAQGLEKKFKALPQVSRVKVSLESKTVDLDFKESQDVTDEKIKEIVTAAGYDVLKIERHE